MKTQEKKLAQAKEDLLKVDPYDYQALGEAQAGIHELEQRIEALEGGGCWWLSKWKD